MTREDKHQLEDPAAVKALAVIASPLQPDISCILEQVITYLTAFLRKANRALRQATLGTLNTLIVSHGDKIGSAAYESIVVELSTLISDSDLHMAALALELCCTLMADNRSGRNVGLTVRNKVLPQALTLIQSTLLQGQALLALQNFFGALVFSANTSFDVLLDSLLSTAKSSIQTGGVAKQALFAVAQCVAVLCLAAGDIKCSSTVNMLTDILKSDSSVNSAKQHLSLLCLGEIGRRKDLSYQQKKQYLLLHFLKEVVVRQSVDKAEFDDSSIEKISTLLFNHCESDEEGVRNVVAECLGKIALTEPRKLVPALKDVLDSLVDPLQKTINFRPKEDGKGTTVVWGKISDSHYIMAVDRRVTTKETVGQETISKFLKTSRKYATYSRGIITIAGSVKRSKKVRKYIQKRMGKPENVTDRFLQLGTEWFSAHQLKEERHPSSVLFNILDWDASRKVYRLYSLGDLHKNEPYYEEIKDVIYACGSGSSKALERLKMLDEPLTLDSFIDAVLYASLFDISTGSLVDAFTFEGGKTDHKNVNLLELLCSTRSAFYEELVFNETNLLIFTNLKDELVLSPDHLNNNAERICPGENLTKMSTWVYQTEHLVIIVAKLPSTACRNQILVDMGLHESCVLPKSLNFKNRLSNERCMCLITNCSQTILRCASIATSLRDLSDRIQGDIQVDLPHVEVGKVKVRFAPEPSGYLHIGHSKAALLTIEEGASKNLNLMEWDKLWAIDKKIIDPVCPRHTAVIEEKRALLVLTDGPKDPFVRILAKHKKYEGAGEKAVTFSNRLWIDYADAVSISVGEEVTLKDWGNAIVKEIKKDENGIVTQLVGVLHLEGNVKKTKLKLTWLPDSSELVRLTLTDFGYLIPKLKLEEDEDFVDVVNPCTKTETLALGESDLRNLKRGDVIQLERKGYYRCEVPFIRLAKPIVLYAIPDGKQQTVAK